MPNALTRTDATRTRDGEDFLGAVREKERDGERGREDRDRLGVVARAREGRALARHQHVQRVPRRQLRRRVMRELVRSRAPARSAAHACCIS